MQINVSQVLNKVSREDLQRFEGPLKEFQQQLHSGTGAGSDFLGWLDVPVGMDTGELAAIRDDMERLVPMVDVFIVVGIGGSYLGGRAVIEVLKHNFSHMLPEEKPHIVYAGHNLSSGYLHDLMEMVSHKDFALVVISKSGTTTEPALAFRLLRGELEKKYGQHGARKRIVAITDKEGGALRKLTREQGYSSYVVPDDVGGRYSVLTAVGLFPVAMAGKDIHQLLKGAKDMRERLMNNNTLDNNEAFMYAAARNALYQKGKTTEIMACYDPMWHYFAEWWKQLFGESEGKEHKGIFPAAVSFTTDLHSLGQYIQEGERNLFETVIHVEKARHVVNVPEDDQNLDKLNYLTGLSVNEINHRAETGTIMAHVDGGVPVIQLGIPQADEYNLGKLIFFFQYACALSGYLLKVNPFDQPGVEAYKNNMFALLGKPGYEKETEKLKKRH